MYSEEIKVLSHSGVKKTKMMKTSFGRYSVSTMLGGLYVCFGTLLSYTVGAMLYNGGSTNYKIGMGLTFGIALCLVIFAGADLFTSNTMTLTASTLEGETSWKDGVKVCVFAWCGSLVGSLITAFLVVKSGIISEEIGSFIVKIVNSKISLTPSEMIIRGIFCNILVCLGAWLAYKMKNEAAKLLMVLWCVFAFFTVGFEHSIANMGLFGIAYLIPEGSSLLFSGAISNLLFVTIGNIIGGAVVLGGSYWYISKEK